MSVPALIVTLPATETFPDPPVKVPPLTVRPEPIAGAPLRETETRRPLTIAVAPSPVKTLPAMVLLVTKVQLVLFPELVQPVVQGRAVALTLFESFTSRKEIVRVACGSSFHWFPV